MTHAVYGNGGALAAMSNARLAEEDARRMAELDELIKADTCPYCRHSLLGALPPAGTKRKRHCNRRACVAAAAREHARRTETARHSTQGPSLMGDRRSPEQTCHIENLEVLEGPRLARVGARERELRALEALLASGPGAIQAARALLRSALSTLAKPAHPPPPQLELWRDWTLHPDQRFRCVRLGCRIRFRACIARQVDSQSANTTRHRGTAPEFPYCLTDRCATGRSIRETFGDEVAVGVRRGPRGDITRALREELERAPTRGDR